MDSPILDSSEQLLENVKSEATVLVSLNSPLAHSEFSGKSQLLTSEKTGIRRTNSDSQVESNVGSKR